MSDMELNATEEAAGAAEAKQPCVALVPLTHRRPSAASEHLTRPDSSFVTHLIAMAQLSPQTRMLRRAAPEDVQAAYRSAANQNRSTPGIRMRQIA